MNGPTPNLEQKIPVLYQIPMNVTTISPTIPPAPVQGQRVTKVRPNILSVQVKRVILKSSGGTDIPAIKTLPLQLFHTSLNTWRHNPSLRNTHAAAVSQLFIQEHLNHLYHTVTSQRKTYDKIKLQHPKR